MRKEFGFPVATADDYREVIAAMGVVPWERIEGPFSIHDYRLRLTDEPEISEFDRFSPRAEVVVLRDPHGKKFNGFRTCTGDWSSVFALLPGDLVPVTVEYLHGADVVVICLPSGVPTKHDRASGDPYALCAHREFEEETGVALDRVVRMNHVGGETTSPRNNTQRFHGFLGMVKTPLEIVPQKLDATEHLKVMLFPLAEWVKFLERGQNNDLFNGSLTMVALLSLGRLKLVW